MTTRRSFLSAGAGAVAGIAFVGCNLCAVGALGAPLVRRETIVAGKRARVVDVHAHCAVPEAMALMGLKLGGPYFRPDLNLTTTLAERLATMDAQGIDIEALSINPYWYEAERDLATRLIRVQNEALAQLCAAHPERFVAYASVALQYPDLAAQQLEEGVRKFALRGAAIGGSVNGEEISAPKFHPFWAKAEELGVVVFIHPQLTGATHDLSRRLAGNGFLDNVVGYPVETSLALSHLIFEGTLDKYPGLKICAAHGGGFLPSYAGRSDFGCLTRPDTCAGGSYGSIKKKPSEYLRQIYYDTMVFSPEALQHLANVVGASQLMVGTDTPYPWTQTAVDEVLAAPGLSDAERVAILGATASTLLGIKA